MFEGSPYYQTFSRIVEGKIVIPVPKEFIIRNYEQVNLFFENNYNKFFNILIKLNFWMVFPNEIYHWIFNNIKIINMKHLLNSILNETDIVKQIRIITNDDSAKLTPKSYIELKLAGYDFCANFAVENEYLSGYGMLNQIAYRTQYKYLINDIELTSKRNRYRTCDWNSEWINRRIIKSDYEEIKYSSFYRELQNSFLINYGIILIFDNIKKLLLNIIKQYVGSYEYYSNNFKNDGIWTVELCSIAAELCGNKLDKDYWYTWEIPDVKVNDNVKINKPYHNKLEMHKIKCVEFKRVQNKPNINKRSFIKHLR
jgi:hypothetical protein